MKQQINELSLGRHLFLLTIALAVCLRPALTLKLDDDDDDNAPDASSRIIFPVTSRVYSPQADPSSLVSYSDSSIKWSNSLVAKSEFLDQNYEIRSQRVDLPASYQNITVLLGSESTVWVTASQASGDTTQADLFKFGFSWDAAKPQSHLQPDQKFFINKFFRNIAILTDSSRKEINLSNDNGKSLLLRATPFRPDFFYFTPDELIILGAEMMNEREKNLWISFDFGQNWIFMAKLGSKSPEWETIKDSNWIYLIDQKQSLVKFEIKKDTLSTATLPKQVLKNEVLNFELFEKSFLFTTVLGSQDMNLEILDLTKEKMATFKQAQFKFSQKPSRITDYNVVSVDNEILVAVFYDLNGSMRTDLFKCTDFENFNFEPTLENIVFDYSSKSLQVKALNNKGGVFLANVYSDKKIKTMVRTAIEVEWKQIQMTPDLQDVYLDLKAANLVFSHEYEQALISRPKSPEFALATGIDQNGVPVGEFTSKNDARKWSQLLKGSYASSYANFGHILLSADTSRPVSELIYTLNKGYEWTRFTFANEPVLVNELITLTPKTAVSPDSAQQLEQFLVVALDPKTKSTILFKINALKLSKETQISAEDEPFCPENCFSIKEPSTSICLTEELKCDGRLDCFDLIDEVDCKPSNPVDEPIESEIVLPINLKSALTTTAFKPNIKSISIEKSAFSMEFSFELAEGQQNGLDLSNINLGVVEILQIPRKKDATIDQTEADFDEKDSVLLYTAEFKSDVFNSVKNLNYDYLEDDASYVCLFFLSEKAATQSKRKVYLLKEKVFFSSRDFDLVLPMEQQQIDSKNRIIITVSISLAIVFILAVFFLFLVRQMRRKSVFPEEQAQFKSEKKKIWKHPGEAGQALIQQYESEKLEC